MLFCYEFTFIGKNFQILFSLKEHFEEKLSPTPHNSLNPILHIEQFSCSYPLKGPSDVIRPPVFGYPQTDLQKTRLSVAELAVPSHASSPALLTSPFISSSLGSHSSSSTSPGCTSERPSPKLREISLFICILGPPQWRTEGGGGVQITPPPHPPKFRRPSKIVANSTRL